VRPPSRRAPSRRTDAWRAAGRAILQPTIASCARTTSSRSDARAVRRAIDQYESALRLDPGLTPPLPGSRSVRLFLDWVGVSPPVAGAVLSRGFDAAIAPCSRLGRRRRVDARGFLSASGIRARSGVSEPAARHRARSAQREAHHQYGMHCSAGATRPPPNVSRALALEPERPSRCQLGGSLHGRPATPKPVAWRTAPWPSTRRRLRVLLRALADSGSATARGACRRRDGGACGRIPVAREAIRALVELQAPTRPPRELGSSVGARSAPWSPNDHRRRVGRTRARGPGESDRALELLERFAPRRRLGSTSGPGVRRDQIQCAFREPRGGSAPEYTVCTSTRRLTALLLAACNPRPAACCSSTSRCRSRPPDGTVNLARRGLRDRVPRFYPHLRAPISHATTSCYSSWAGAEAPSDPSPPAISRCSPSGCCGRRVCSLRCDGEGYLDRWTATAGSTSWGPDLDRRPAPRRHRHPRAHDHGRPQPWAEPGHWRTSRWAPCSARFRSTATTSCHPRLFSCSLSARGTRSCGRRYAAARPRAGVAAAADRRLVVSSAAMRSALWAAVSGPRPLRCNSSTPWSDAGLSRSACPLDSTPAEWAHVPPRERRAALLAQARFPSSWRPRS